MDLLGEYCSPEMAELIGRADALLGSVELVSKVELKSHSGEVVGFYYLPLGVDLKQEVKAMIVKAHGLGYTEGTADWG